MRECRVFRAMNYRSMAVASLLFWISYPGAVSQTAPASQLNWRSELFAWREAQAKKLQAPDGWLSLAGLEWLNQGDNTFGSASDNGIGIDAVVAPPLGGLR